jgi:hypothetical protein
MEFSFDKPDDVPMSVKMERALAAFKRMPPAEAYQIFVKAGVTVQCLDYPSSLGAGSP